MARKIVDQSLRTRRVPNLEVASAVASSGFSESFATVADIASLRRQVRAATEDRRIQVSRRHPIDAALRETREYRVKGMSYASIGALVDRNIKKAVPAGRDEERVQTPPKARGIMGKKAEAKETAIALAHGKAHSLHEIRKEIEYLQGILPRIKGKKRREIKHVLHHLMLAIGEK